MRNLKVLAAAAVAFAAAQSGAAVVYDANVTSAFIGGTGIANGGFAVDRNITGTRTTAIEVGLRARVRYDTVTDDPTNVFNSNGDGTYSHAAGSPAAAPTRARWNFDWSANSDYNTGAVKLSAFHWELGIDYNPTAAADYVVLDLLSQPVFDHSFGSNATATGAGVEGNAITLATANNLMQNSWNLDFFDTPSLLPLVPTTFDPSADGNYSFFLRALDNAGNVLARTDITVIVGEGAVEVPEPGSLALAGLALLGAVAVRRRRS